MAINGISTKTTFEVFDSGGKWDFLLGKTLLETLKAVHDYEQDKITIQGAEGEATLVNQAYIKEAQQNPTSPVCIVTDETQPDEDDQLSEINIETLKNDTNLFT